MTNLHLLKEEIKNITQEIDRYLLTYKDLDKSQRNQKDLLIQDKINEARAILEDANSQLLMWDVSESKDASDYINSAKVDLNKLEINFEKLKKWAEEREILLGSANSNEARDQQRLLEQNRDQIERGSGLISELSRGVSQAKDTGINIMTALNDQGQHMRDIDAKLTRLDTNIETGEDIIATMICRDKRRTIFLWIVIGMLAVSIVIFLYLLFK